MSQSPRQDFKHLHCLITEVTKLIQIEYLVYHLTLMIFNVVL